MPVNPHGQRRATRLNAPSQRVSTQLNITILPNHPRIRSYLLPASARSVLNSALMNPEIINDGQPVKRTRAGGGRAFHSRLEPFVEFIREQRQRRKTWKEIAAALSGQKDCAITAQGVHQFYRRHLLRRAKGHWEDETNQSVFQPVHSTVTAGRPQNRTSPLPLKPDYKQPDISKFNLDHFT
jgi:hypothetical protein